jgi:3-(3-hydroxy-phenyl)propionate hydroxylase
LRLDDVLGEGAWLITRGTVPQASFPPGLHVFALDDRRLGPFREQLIAWLDKHKTNAVLVRPDRYVFATGEPAALIGAFREQLGESANFFRNPSIT